MSNRTIKNYFICYIKCNYTAHIVKKKKKTKFKIFTREINLQMNVDECFAWAHQKMRRKACKWKMRFYAAFGSM